VMACSKLGAIWIPIFSGFGPDAVAARLVDGGAVALWHGDAGYDDSDPAREGARHHPAAFVGRCA